MSARKGWISKPANRNDLQASAKKEKANSRTKIDSRREGFGGSQSKGPTRSKPHQGVGPIPHRHLEHIPSGNRHLTESEQLASVEEAKARGLGDGWKAEFNNRLKRRVWVSPRQNRKYASIPDALAGIPMPALFKSEEREQKRKERQAKVAKKQAEGVAHPNRSITTRRIPKRKRKAGDKEGTGSSLEQASEIWDANFRNTSKKSSLYGNLTNKSLSSRRRKAKRIKVARDEGYASSEGEISEDDRNSSAMLNNSTIMKDEGMEIQEVVELDTKACRIVSL